MIDVKAKTHLPLVGTGLDATSLLKSMRLAIGFLMLLGVHAHAVIWDYEYEGTNLTSSPWTVSQPGRMATDPPNTWLQINGTQGDAYTYINGGNQWDVGSSFTVEFRLNLVTQGAKTFAQQACLGDGSGIWQIQISTTSVQILAATTVTKSIAIGADTWHTYRLVVNAGLASLYLDNDPTAIISGIAKSTVTVLDVIRLGDYGTAAAGDGQWDDVRWNNSVAYAPIPEPSSALLLGCGLLVWFVSRSRK